MKIYKFRTKIRKSISKVHNHYGITLIPTIQIGKDNDIDYLKESKTFGDQEATVYYLAFNWLIFVVVFELWGEREKKGGEE